MRSWSPSAEQKLRALYGKQPLARIAFLLKRTATAIKSRAGVLGLVTGKVQRWSTKECKLLRQLYSDSSTAHLVEVFNRPNNKIYARASKLGLRKSAAFHENAKLSGRFDKLSRAGAAFRYPKGHAPANKGLRRPGYAPGRMASTQFKKGQIPHNGKLEIGQHRVDPDGYTWVKVSHDKVGNLNYRALHRIVWEKAHGPIPPKHIVAFKNGDKKQVRLDNLECITKGENARRNRMWTKYPKELADVLRLKGVVNRMINKRLGKPERKEKNRERREASRRVVRNALRAARQGKPDGHRAGKGRRAGG